MPLPLTQRPDRDPCAVLSPYSSSKHAVAAFASAFRMEAAHMGVDVCTCLPSFHQTPLLIGHEKKIRKIWDEMPQSTRDTYGEACFASAAIVTEQTLTDWAWDPARVVEGLTRAATRVQSPPRELAIGADAKYFLDVVRRFPPAVYETCIYYGMCWDLVEHV